MTHPYHNGKCLAQQACAECIRLAMEKKIEAQGKSSGKVFLVYEMPRSKTASQREAKSFEEMGF